MVINKHETKRTKEDSLQTTKVIRKVLYSKPKKLGDIIELNINED